MPFMREPSLSHISSEGPIGCIFGIWFAHLFLGLFLPRGAEAYLFYGMVTLIAVVLGLHLLGWCRHRRENLSIIPRPEPRKIKPAAGTPSGGPGAESGG